MNTSVPLAVVIATLALLFTVGSFWWLHARRGRLMTYEPQAFAAGVASGGTFILRLPLVIFNSGARAEVVLDLRVRFLDDPVFTMTWNSRHEELDLLSEGPLATPFHVNGRRAVRVVAQFVERIPRVALDRRVYVVQIEARIGDRWQWETLAQFHLHAENLWQLPDYVAHANRVIATDPGSEALGNAALAKVRRQYGQADY